jgi:hypothetical protein
MTADQFWQNVDRGGPVHPYTPELGRCWTWRKGKGPHGYGSVQFNGRTARANRVAWQLANGPIPDGMCVCHSCDNPPCCRPGHLYLDTNQGNMDDKVRKGRSYRPTGDRNGARRHPENMTRGDRHWSRRCPERVPRGENSVTAKLTESKVMVIRQRSENESMEQLAREYGVTKATIFKAVHRKTWRHVL